MPDNWNDLIAFRSKFERMHPQERIVATNGCFDIIHAGHIKMLTEAAKHGFLVVGLNGDESVRLLKGPTRPINKEGDRKIVLESIKPVYHVHIFPEERATKFLLYLRPHCYVKAGDYNINNLDSGEKEVLQEYKTEIIFVNFVSGLSTTKIVESL